MLQITYKIYQSLGAIASRLQQCFSIFLSAAARLIFGLSKFEHITPALKQLHWLPIRYHIQFMIMTIVYKAVHDFKESKQSKYSLRSVNGINLCERRSHLKACGDRAFSVCVPKLWNTLPSEVGTSETVYLFKKCLKTLFQTLDILDITYCNVRLDIRYCKAPKINKLFILFHAIKILLYYYYYYLLFFTHYS